MLNSILHSRRRRGGWTVDPDYKSGRSSHQSHQNVSFVVFFHLHNIFQSSRSHQCNIINAMNTILRILGHPKALKLRGNIAKVRVCRTQSFDLAFIPSEIWSLPAVKSRLASVVIGLCWQDVLPCSSAWIDRRIIGVVFRSDTQLEERAKETDVHVGDG